MYNLINSFYFFLTGDIRREEFMIRKSKMKSKSCKPFICEFCEKTFSWKDLLNVHQRIHTKEKPFKCEDCGKIFSQKSHLNVHGRIHTGKKPFKYDICEKTFGVKGNLDKHKRIQIEKKFL